MKRSSPKKINVFLSLDQEVIKGYFNAQDPSPIYKRQLSYEFEQYIMNCIASCKKNSIFNYKFSYRNEEDKEYLDPLMFAIRRHFLEKKSAFQKQFERFKIRTYTLLFVSLAVVMVTHYLLPFIINHGQQVIQNGLNNGLDVFSWVILWKPIDRLVFYWNPFLKDISIMDRLHKAETILVEVETGLETTDNRPSFVVRGLSPLNQDVA
jgi:hypothetical protein